MLLAALACRERLEELNRLSSLTFTERCCCLLLRRVVFDEVVVFSPRVCETVVLLAALFVVLSAGLEALCWF